MLGERVDIPNVDGRLPVQAFDAPALDRDDALALCARLKVNRSRKGGFNGGSLTGVVWINRVPHCLQK